MAQLQADTITLPTHWACYLINGDASGLEDGEQERIDAKLAEIEKIRGPFTVVSCNGDTERFTWSFRQHGGDAQGGDVCEYDILV